MDLNTEEALDQAVVKTLVLGFSRGLHRDGIRAIEIVQTHKVRINRG